MTKRVNVHQYTGNQQYKVSGTAGVKHCFGCGQHRASAGGKVLGKLKMFYCAECVSKRATKKEQAK